MIRTLKVFTLVGIVALVAGCSGKDYPNLVHPDHAPIYQNVNTVEKAREFYANTTRVGTKRLIIAQDGTVLNQNGRATVQQGVTPLEAQNIGKITAKNVGYWVMYFAPDGNGYLAVSGDPRVENLTWRIQDSGRGYPRLCLQSKTSNEPEECYWPRSLFSDNANLPKLYPGDIARMSGGRYPARLNSASSINSTQGFVKALGTGNPQPFIDR